MSVAFTCLAIEDTRRIRNGGEMSNKLVKMLVSESSGWMHEAVYWASETKKRRRVKTLVLLI
jgi:hypothetical protein